jgi:hypothetical protein
MVKAAQRFKDKGLGEINSLRTFPAANLAGAEVLFSLGWVYELPVGFLNAHFKQQDREGRIHLSLRRAIQQILIMHVKKGGRACAQAICSGAQTAAEHAPLRTHPESFGHGARIRTRQFKKCRASSHRDSDEMRATCGMILRVNCLFLRPETGLIQLLIIKRFFP